MPQTTEILPNGLSLLQDDRFFKLGQDSVLLSAFAKIRRRAKVLDLGCGTGALALLCWREDLTVTGLEIQQDALDLFRRSIERNRLENVTALHGDLRHMRTLLPHGSMDYVICNPPYFGRNTGAAAPSAEKRTARQDICCTVEEVAVAASFVLHTGGKAALDDVAVAGKTGTHERGDGSDDSWFVGMAPAADPKVVVAVVIEKGESGAGASAAHDVLETALEVTGAL